MEESVNELLTRFGRGAPMGEMLREYWAPIARSAALEADGAPVRVKLLSERYVAWRTSDGRVVVFDEACPHRGASLALARNEDNALRCLFHGWKIDATGQVLETPCESEDKRAAFAASQRVRSYPVREAGRLVWVYVGKKEAPPPFPHFDFMDLPDSHIEVRRAVVPYNWLQGLEAHLDSAHLGILHASSAGSANWRDKPSGAARDIAIATMHTSPRIEMDLMPYGLREGALRPLPDETVYARIRQVVLPYFVFIPFGPDTYRSWRASVPIDDETNAEWYMLYHMKRPMTAEDCEQQWIGAAADPDNFAANLGTPENMWHQDRAAMKEGHFTGLMRCVPFEDFIVQASMGSRVDRNREHLAPSDAIIVHTRRMLQEALANFRRDASLAWQSSDIDYTGIHALATMLAKDASWREAVMANDHSPAQQKRAG
jgi:phthalate 4,5-dioxygenase oxygenase subunit